MMQEHKDLKHIKIFAESIIYSSIANWAHTELALRRRGSSGGFRELIDRGAERIYNPSSLTAQDLEDYLTDIFYRTPYGST